ncbi:hypothetical protein [Bacteroides faecis]|uniref:hypothetical protein n=1 Tax=Bacteroides faecis TaxID=674529 RepID=UPI00101EB726|nr:hypothetical protein [Bacteroides faecis]KAA5263696.1 hypothetical protein F2Z41_22090 [Bacteroides faecis]MCE9012296.1 hypothetical protein [Bacteroides faecis]RYT81269.1 hypothetical protein EAJ04_22195 [Bacteroides faecis]
MSYIETLLKEKDIDLGTWLLEDKGQIGLTIEMLIEFVYSMPDATVQEVENTFRKIDFKNGDVMHYVTFLAEGMIETAGY